MTDKLLFAGLLETDINGVPVLSSCGGLFEEKKAFHIQTSSNTVSYATDGTPSMVGHHFGFLSISFKKLFR